MKTVHKTNGCAWANGQLQLADTNQTDDWSKVTCRHCMNKKIPRGYLKIRGMSFLEVLQEISAEEEVPHSGRKQVDDERTR